MGGGGGVHSLTICCLSNKLSPLSVDPFWEELCQAGKQIESHNNCVPFTLKCILQYNRF